MFDITYFLFYLTICIFLISVSLLVSVISVAIITYFINWGTENVIDFLRFWKNREDALKLPPLPNDDIYIGN